MSASQRIVISGYYGFSNTGDEAVLEAIVNGIRSQPGASPEFTVLSASPKVTSERLGVKAVPRMSLRDVTRAIRECDLFISGGGSLLQDATSSRSLLYYLATIRLARMLRRKVMALGQGIGPLTKPFSRRVTASTLNGVDLITVRDAQSAALIREIGVNGPPVHVTADPTFLLDPCSDDDSKRLVREAGILSNEEFIAVALRECPGSPSAVQAAREGLKILADALPVRILLLTMHRPYDLVLARRMRKTIAGLAIQPREWSGPEMMGVLKRSRMVIAMRLHALLFAASVGVSSAGITYDPKVASFLESTGQMSISLDEVISGAFPGIAKTAWENRSIQEASLTQVVPTLRTLADNNMSMAMELLSGG